MKKSDLIKMIEHLPDDQEIIFNVSMDSGRGSCGGVATNCDGKLFGSDEPFEQTFTDDEITEELTNVFVVYIGVSDEWYD